MSDLTYWLKDAASILRSNGTETHAAEVAKAADLIDALHGIVADLVRTCRPETPTLQAADALRRARAVLAALEITQEPNHE